MADDSGIDPRYPAQFQRGYNPSIHGAAPVLATPSPETIPVEPTPSAAGTGPVAESALTPAIPGDAEATDMERLFPEQTAADGDAAGVDRHRTPRPAAEWVLLAAAIAMLLAGVWLIQLLIEYADGSLADEADLWRIAVTNVLPGPLLLGGVVALLLWIALRATTAGRRR